MNVRELRRLLTDLDDDTVVWCDVGDVGLAGVEGAKLIPAQDDVGPRLLLRAGRLFDQVAADNQTPKLI